MTGQRASAGMAEKKAGPFQPQQARPRARDWHTVRFPRRPEHLQPSAPWVSPRPCKSYSLDVQARSPNGVIERWFEEDVRW